MATQAHPPEDFIAYPTNRVVGTIPDLKDARAAIEALLLAGFARQDIEILHGEEDLHRPDPTGAEHRFLAQFQRALSRKLAEYKHLRLGEEFEHLRHFIEDLRAGRCVVMVLAKKRDRREAAAEVLCTHGAKFVEFYGRWSWQELEAHPHLDPAPGRTYEAHLDGAAVRVRMDTASTVTILRRPAGSADLPSSDLSQLPVRHLRPRLLLLARQEADRTTNVQVYDFESCVVNAVVSHADGRVHHASGTVRRVD